MIGLKGVDTSGIKPRPRPSISQKVPAVARTVVPFAKPQMA
jgi:hypothetical protein